MNLEELSKQFRRLPGVGPRTAEKMAYYWLTLEDDEAERFLRTLENFRRQITLCKRCHNLAGERSLQHLSG